MAFNIGSYSESKLLQKCLINFEQNGSCDQKMLLLKYSKVYIILFLVNFIYLLLGMAIVAMCYYLLKEEVSVKLAYLRDKLRTKVFVMKQMLSPTI